MQAEDPLSRRPDHEDGIKHNNTESVLLKPEFFTIAAVNAVYKLVFDNFKILKEVKTALLSDKVIKNYKSLLSSEPCEFSKSLQDWNFENDLLLYRGKIYIPKSENNTLR